MDKRFEHNLRKNARVAVYMGAAELHGTPPIVTTATVLGRADDHGRWWLSLDIAQNETLPQMYRVEEIIGFLMPMAVIERSADGQTVTGTFVEDSGLPGD